MENQKILDISTKTIIKISLTIIVFYILYAVKDILVWFFFALIVSVLFNPAIDFFQKRKIPRMLGALLVYVGFFGLFGMIIYMAVPFFSNELTDFIEFLPLYFTKISPPLSELGFEPFSDLKGFLESFGGNLDAMKENILNVFVAFFGGVFTTLFVVVTALFLSLEKDLSEKVLILIFPKKYEAAALAIWARCQKKVTGWFVARLIACLFVGVASYITFLVFNVNYPFTLALFSAVLNFIPYVGPFLTGILLFIIIFPVDIFKAIFVLISFTLIQQIEGQILTPILMKRIIGLPPSLVLISLVIGGKIWGVLGAILIVPIAGIVFEFLREFLEKRKAREGLESS
ncbi:MAG: AI-2E family transporter [Candidatus Pacebacteria bacterium]|nr:AI-2E family transporter [Candidatus Paceibacterota bacterium]